MATLAETLTRPILAIGTPLSLMLVLATLPLVLPLAIPIIFLVLLVLLVALLLVLMLVLLALLVLLVRHTPQLLNSPKFAPNPDVGDQATSGRGASIKSEPRMTRKEGFGRKRLGSCHEFGFELDHDENQDMVSSIPTARHAIPSSPAFGIDSPRKR